MNKKLISERKVRQYLLILVFCFLLIGQSTLFCFAQNNGKDNMNKEKRFQNRLKDEKSPYLLQHKDNPVNWYPWGDEAFEKAKKENKLIFLSIGYSTCHWCHVMEHESFEDETIAAKINEHFVAIKVDREERPDIDNIYMSAVMAMTGSGGWPLTVFLTPDKHPVFGGTYFPPYPKWGSPGLMSVMESVHRAWTDDSKRLLQSGQMIVSMLEERKNKEPSEVKLQESILNESFQNYERNFDEQFGGFGSAPKFPSSHNLSFLLRYYRRTNNVKALNMVEKTLQEMALGGMYDQIGGGFHRYSTDREWQIPHFEKMLYDQATLSKTYLEAYQITKKPFYAVIAREILEYVLRDMHDEKGGFYSAEDADSLDPDEYGQITVDPNQSLEKKEGSFYLWRYDEINEYLEEKDAQIFIRYFGVESEGNAKNDPHGEFKGKNVIYIKEDIEDVAKHFAMSVEEVEKSLERSSSRLMSIREKRPRPHLDDKVLVDWNGLMISSLALGSQILKDDRYLKEAEHSAQFIINNLIDKEGRLLHRYRQGESGILGSIEDYAYFIDALITLYEATAKSEYLKLGYKLASDALERFEDKKQGGFYFTADDAEKLLFREKEVHDGAIPSGNSVMALNLVRLYHITLDKQWEEALTRLLDVFAETALAMPTAYAQLMIAFDYVLGPSQEIVLAGNLKDDTIVQMKRVLNEYFLSNKVLIYHLSDSEELNEIIKIAPFIKNQGLIDGKATAYVCENHRCKLPVNDVASFEKQLKDLK